MLGHGVVDFGVGLSVHHQTRFQGLDFVCIAVEFLDRLLIVLLRHK